jgi:hypothetical protein
MRANRQYRVAVDGIQATELRRYGLSTPQGFDPLLTVAYKAAIEKFTAFRTNRLFDIAPGDQDLLRRLGVRYYLTREGAAHQGEVAANLSYRLVGSSGFFMQVYEFQNAAPPWQWDGEGETRCSRWEPELREFTVQGPGRLVLIEQFYPGWRGSVDGRQTGIERAEGVFQSIAAPAGSHTIRFEYRPESLRAGAVISVVSWVGLGVWVWAGRRGRERG